MSEKATAIIATTAIMASPAALVFLIVSDHTFHTSEPQNRSQTNLEKECEGEPQEEKIKHLESIIDDYQEHIDEFCSDDDEYSKEYEKVLNDCKANRGKWTVETDAFEGIMSYKCEIQF